MQDERKYYLKKILKSVLIFSLISIPIISYLGYIGIPLLSAIWSYIIFDLFAFITLIELTKREKKIFAIFFFMLTFILGFIHIYNYGDFARSKFMTVWLFVNIGVFILYSLFSILNFILFVKRIINEKQT